MIIQVTEQNKSMLLDFFKHSHPQLTKIECHYRAYGLDYSFCPFYICVQDDVVTTAMTMMNDTLLVYTIQQDTTELHDFIQMMPVTTVSVNQLGSSLCHDPVSGTILKCSVVYPAVTSIDIGKIDDAFQILEQAFPGVYDQEMYSGWYCEMSHSIRHGISKLYQLEHATATAMFIGERMVVLNQIATHPSEQRMGIARKLVQAVTNEFTTEGKQVFVYSRNAQTDLFYGKLGFEQYECWIEYSKN